MEAPGLLGMINLAIECFLNEEMPVQWSGLLLNQRH